MYICYFCLILFKVVTDFHQLTQNEIEDDLANGRDKENGVEEKETDFWLLGEEAES